MLGLKTHRAAFWGQSQSGGFLSLLALLATYKTHLLCYLHPKHYRCKETGESKVILTTLCGHGHFDMSSYAKYLDGGLQVTGGVTDMVGWGPAIFYAQCKRVLLLCLQTPCTVLTL